ncbi:DUF3994 domain-containing protein [Bacillus thuringiensis]|uniref:DUF3994 domain-containing protein n=1 Tax=Bacillus thuringiensis TaxID=1428 RepID=UPI000BFB3197|nr:DUF3994 domain-containing protein [Bacillus thuringiensis]PGT57001.1 hypothetical protein COD16_26070 [Bacillus thuringiensis]
MKSKKLITLAIPVMLLVGCDTIQDPPKKEAKTEESSKAKATEQDKKSTSLKDNEKDIQRIRVLEEDYPQYMLDMEKDLVKRLIFYKDSIKYYQKGSKLREEVLVSIKDYMKVLDKIESIDAHSKYKEDHKEVLKAVSKYRESFEEVEKVFKKTDFSMEADKEVLEKADSKLSEGNRIWIPVFEKLKNESKKVESSSDSSSEDVSSNFVPKSSSPNSSQSDKSQAQTGMFKGIVGTDEELGINDSNTSRYIKNERSIVGKYGIDLGEGVKTILDLKGDMTFAFYKYGDFPSRDSLMKGTYELDVPSLQLTLKLTSVTENGHKIQRTESFRYQVQNYDLNMLQLYSADEDARMRLIKQG